MTAKIEFTKKILQNFVDIDWPNATLYTGVQINEKFSLLEKYLQLTFSDPLFNLKEETHLLYIFEDKTIQIGDIKSAKKGTIRHCLQHFIPYSVQKEQKKIVIFLNANKILPEAESSLLKVIEEPPNNTHFIFCTPHKELMKDTIISRCIEVPFFKENNQENISDPWNRFWAISTYKETNLFLLLQSKGWIEKIQSVYDSLEFHKNDIVKFEEFNIAEITTAFKPEKLDTRIEILKICFLPLYFSLRDLLTDGILNSVGPIHIPNKNIYSTLYCLHYIESFFYDINIKYFSTRNINLEIVYIKFLMKFLQKWGV